MNKYPGRLTAGVLVVALVGAALAQPWPYVFTVDPTRSGLNGAFGLDIATAGTLIGNWDPVENPTGTRTKPGLFGSFGENENLPVPVNVGFGLQGRPNTRSTGGFEMLVGIERQALALSALQMDLLASGPTSADLVLRLAWQAFRTRNPTSVYPAIPMTLPIGQVAVTAMGLEQIGAAPGLLTEIEPGRYEFTVTPLVNLTAAFQFMGEEYLLPAMPMVLPLAGELLLAGETALVTSVQPLEWEGSTPVNLPLPQFPLALPTVLPPGQTANLLFDLVVNEIGATLGGTLTTVANGVLIPEPTGLLALGLGALLLRRVR